MAHYMTLAGWSTCAGQLVETRIVLCAATASQPEGWLVTCTEADPTRETIQTVPRMCVGIPFHDCPSPSDKTVQGIACWAGRCIIVDSSHKQMPMTCAWATKG